MSDIKKQKNKRINQLLVSTMTNNTETIIKTDGSASSLIKVYTVANQAMFGMVAMPASIIYSIGPIFLFQNNVGVQTIGYVMSAGEGIGLVGRKAAEYMENGFVFRRPNDLYFLVGMMAVPLVLFPVWPADLWYMSLICLILILASYKVSLTVVAESVHRLSVLGEKPPAKMFAEANFVQRFACGLIGLLAPLLYGWVPGLPFELFGGFVLVFFMFFWALDKKITSIHRDSQRRSAHNRMAKKSIIARLQSFNSRSLSEFLNTPRRSLNKSTRTSRESYFSRRSSFLADNYRFPEELSDSDSVPPKCCDIEVIEEEGNEFESVSDDAEDLEEGLRMSNQDVTEGRVEAECPTNTDEDPCNEPNTEVNEEHGEPQDDDLIDSTDQENTGGTYSEATGADKRPKLSFYHETTNALSVEKIEEVTASDSEIEPSQDRAKSGRRSLEDYLDAYSYFLIVQAFSFFDLFIIYFPFPFLSIALGETEGFLMSGVIFGYQMGRALSQYIQVWRCDHLTNYVLNGICLLAYLGFVIYVEVSDGYLWCIPLIFTSFSETMPVQQLYLLRHYTTKGISHDDMEVRAAVKASWTACALAASLSCLIASQTYEAVGLRGVAYVGLVVMVMKIATILQIDCLHARKMKLIGSKNKRARESILSFTESMRDMSSCFLH